MAEAQINALASLSLTLADLGSAERQRLYKAAVPFVHVPLELIAQCEDFERYLTEDPLFRVLFTEEEVGSLMRLFAAIEAYDTRRCRDVDTGILDDPAWCAIMASASELHLWLVARGRFEPPG